MKTTQPKKNGTRVIVAVLACTLLVGLTVFLFSFSARFSILTMAPNWQLRISGSVKDLSAASVSAAPDFRINIVSLETISADGRKTLYLPLFLYRENARWIAVPYSDTAKYPAWFIFTDKSAENYLLTINSSFVEQCGSYTIIQLSAHDLAKEGIQIEEIHDTLGSKPLLLSSEMIPMVGADAEWLFPHFADRHDPTDYDTASSAPVQDFSYLFLIQDIPEDYVLFAGEQILFQSAKGYPITGKKILGT